MGRPKKNATEEAVMEKEVEKTSGKKSPAEKEEETLKGIKNILENLQQAFGTDKQDMSMAYVNMLFADKKIKDVFLDNMDMLLKSLSEDTKKLIMDIKSLKDEER